MGCVFPLILAGLLFAAYGYVSLVVFVAHRLGPVAAVQAGALVLLTGATLLLLRGLLLRWYGERKARQL